MPNYTSTRSDFYLAKNKKPTFQEAVQLLKEQIEDFDKTVSKIFDPVSEVERSDK